MVAHRLTDLPQPPAGLGFIIGPVCDSLFIIGAHYWGWSSRPRCFRCRPRSAQAKSSAGAPNLRHVFVMSFTAAHLVLVYFRSHANPRIFRTFPFRFTVVPAALVVATALSLRG